MTSRREFLKRGTWMALAAGVPLNLGEKGTGIGIISPSLRRGLTMRAFESQINTDFFMNDDALKVKVTLVKVTNIGSKKETASGKEGFSLIFRGPQDTLLKQDTYVIEHEELGMFSFLVVPIGKKDKSAPLYEAVVNRLHP